MVSENEIELGELGEKIVRRIQAEERLRVWTLIELDMMTPEEVKPRIKALIIKEEND